MVRFPSRDWVAGAILLIVGLSLLAGRLVPGVDRLVPLLVGLVLIGVFFLTRSPGALIPGGIVTGVGVGILVATQGDPEFGGAGFLMSVGGGFFLVWFLGAFYQVPDTRFWPLVPGSILVAIGALIFAGRMGQQVLRFAGDWWPAILVIVGAYMIVAARFRRRMDDDDATVTAFSRPADPRADADRRTADEPRPSDAAPAERP